jgi:hypothetical protein
MRYVAARTWGVAAILVVSACGKGPPAVSPASASVDAGALAPPAGSPPAAPSATEPSAAPPIAAPIPTAPVRASEVATLRSGGPSTQCLRKRKATTVKDVSGTVGVIAKQCEAAAKTKLVGKTIAGKQSDREKPQAFPLEARAHHCYRAYAQAAEGIRNIDVSIDDSAGIVVAEDATDEPSAVVPREGAVCFGRDDRASVVVSVGAGGGEYALQIWGDE